MYADKWIFLHQFLNTIYGYFTRSSNPLSHSPSYETLQSNLPFNRTLYLMVIRLSQRTLQIDGHSTLQLNTTIYCPIILLPHTILNGHFSLPWNKTLKPTHHNDGQPNYWPIFTLLPKTAVYCPGLFLLNTTLAIRW